ARALTRISALPLLALAALPALAAPARPQWNPTAGQWLKDSPSDLRIMTFNVRDGLCSTNDKSEGPGNWCALARLVAAMKPDVLLRQETGDTEGNAPGPAEDSVADLSTTMNLFLHGGSDPFKAGSPRVTSWVQLYDPAFDLPFVFVSFETDGF